LVRVVEAGALDHHHFLVSHLQLLVEYKQMVEAQVHLVHKMVVLAAHLLD